MGNISVHHSTHSTRLTAAKCRRAGHLASSSPTLIVVLIISSIVSIITFTIWLRYTARPSTPTEEKATPDAAATANAEPAADGESENAPPPYTPPAATLPVTEPAPTPVKAVVDFPNPKDTAPAFVRGTIYFSLLVFNLVILGLSLQYVNYCPKVDPNAPLDTGGFVRWVFYGIFALFASSGLVSWGLLCWYVGGGKKQDIMLDIIPLSLAVAIFLPFYGVYEGSVALVRVCQKSLCGVALEEEQDTVVAEEAVVDVEMQRLMKGDNEGDDDDEVVFAGRS
ncbi:hypothetical protein O988_05027 [Pseudogymnoascus sp. VKM F-3808]|nr:hypothetical protein O988_05027 [Pseudogymnoascus sp. VKM F-3808]